MRAHKGKRAVTRRSLLQLPVAAAAASMQTARAAGAIGENDPGNIKIARRIPCVGRASNTVSRIRAWTSCGLSRSGLRSTT